MVAQNDMQKLIEAHVALGEPMDTAIWLRQEEGDAWLLEVLPSMANDDRADQPVNFNPGQFFRHPLHLYIGNRASIERAIRTSRELAQAVAEGEVLHGEDVGQELMALAKDVLAEHDLHGHP